LAEEARVLFTAVTRTKGRLYLVKVPVHTRSHRYEAESRLLAATPRFSNLVQRVRSSRKRHP
jgi:superfamily I DNA/RNA helicase